MYVIRKRLAASEGSAPDTRYDPECDCMVTSTDGGETWVENEGADPRSNPAYLMPPNAAPDVRCAAAAGMVEDIRRVVNAGITGGGVVGIGTILIAFLVLPFGLLWLLISTIAAAISGIGSFALNESFDEGVYAFLTCAFIENVDAEGRIDEAGYNDVMAQASAEYSNDVIDTMLALVWQMHGAVGMSNAGSLYADPEADCPCGGCVYILHDTPDDYTKLNIVQGELIDHFEGHYLLCDVSAAGQENGRCYVNIPAGITITNIYTGWYGVIGVSRGTVMHNAYDWDGFNEIATTYTQDYLDLPVSLSSGFIGWQINSDSPLVTNLTIIQLRYTVAEGYEDPFLHNC